MRPCRDGELTEGVRGTQLDGMSALTMLSPPVTCRGLAEVPLRDLRSVPGDR